MVAATYFRYVPGQVGGAIELLEGSSLLLTHADPIPVFLGWTPWHDIISRAETEDGEPLFSSPFLAFGETAVVQGVDALPRGTYPFYCSTHVGEGMMGELVIV